MEESAHHLTKGQTINDRYVVESMLGQGGMGCVYRVEQHFLHKTYALKTLNPDHLTDIAWRRFQKEAQATSALDHPGLIKVYDFGMIDESQPYYVMDFVHGETLSQHLERSGALPLGDNLTVFSHVCEALAHAHKQGVVHRDIKPSNIMIAPETNGDFQVKVVDFGIAKLINAGDRETMALTRTGEIFGTPYYMSPEQCLGTAIDNRSDIYSLGCVLFQCLAGTPPFVGDTALAVMMQHQSTDPPSLKEASLGKEFPPAIEAVVRKMLAKRPQDRYQTLSDVAGDLELVKLGQHVSASSKTSSETKVQSSTVIKVALFCLVGSLLLAGAFLIGRTTSRPQGPQPSVVSSAVESAPATDTAGSGENSVGANSAGYYSTLGRSDSNATKNMRTFHFGSDLLPGVMFFPPSVDCLSAEVMKDGSKKVFARGDVAINNFQPFKLLASDDAGEHANVLRRFRPDEVQGVFFRAIDDSMFHDQALAELVGLKSLSEVKVVASRNITNNCLKYLDQLPNLTDLSLAQTFVTGSAVAKLKRIRQLHSLDLNGLNDDSGADVLTRIGGSHVLQALGLRRSKLDDARAKAVTSCPNIKVLDISGSFITDATINDLLKLKQLEELNVIDCKYTTDKSFLTLSKLPRLKVLTCGSSVDPHKFDKTTPALLKALQGRCEVHFDL